MFSRLLSRPKQQEVLAQYADLQAKYNELLLQNETLQSQINSRAVRSADPALFPRALGQRLEKLRLLLIGSCQVAHLVNGAGEFGYTTDYYLYDSSPYAEMPNVTLEGRDAAIVGLTLRWLMQEAIDRAMDLAHSQDFWTDEEAQSALDKLTGILDRHVSRFREALGAGPIFFFSFAEPSFNYVGNLISASSPKELRFFIRRLNDIFGEVVAKYTDCYILDINDCINMVGRAHLADDAVSHFTHNSFINDGDDTYDSERILPLVSNTSIFDVGANMTMLHQVIFNRLSDNIKILRQLDMVKIIIVDLDDTMWRGVAAEENFEGAIRVEGWPIGLAEALLFFKRRGGLLAICSKNDYESTVERFKQIWGERLPLDNFVSVKINWQPKSSNISEILAEVNLLPESAVFIDDNPREIDEVRAHFPTLRCLGGNHRDWRRIVLQSPETQVAKISKESQARTQLVRAKIDRESAAKALSREEWLQSLQLKMDVHLVNSPSHRFFPRTMELINKTNQFNTTGKRWTLGELEALFAEGGVAVTSSLRDKTTDNGLIGVTLVRSGEIVQSVLSCRVFGLGSESASGAIATKIALTSKTEVRATVVDTGKNATCHDYFLKIGFTDTGAGFVATEPCLMPDWIEVSIDGEDALLKQARHEKVAAPVM